MYVNFKEVVVALYHQADDEDEKLEPSDDEDLEGEYGSDDDGVDDDVDDDADDKHLHLSNTMVASQHPFGEPSFMRALDLEAMYAPEFLEYMNLGR